MSNPDLKINSDLKLIHKDLLNFYGEFSKQLKDKHGKIFKIFEGHRSLERQKILFSQGFSKTMKSRHLSNPSEAIDIIEFPYTWKGFILSKEYSNFVNAFLKNSKWEKIEWGGNWKTFKDLPHFQLKNET